MFGIKPLIVFAVASFYFSIMHLRIWVDLLVLYAIGVKHFLEHLHILFPSFVVPKVFGKLFSVICLHTLDRELEVFNRMLEEYRGRIATVARKNFQIALP